MRCNVLTVFFRWWGKRGEEAVNFLRRVIRLRACYERDVLVLRYVILGTVNIEDEEFYAFQFIIHKRVGSGIR